MKKLKIGLKYFAVFILGLTIGVFSEDSLHQLVRHLYVRLTYDKISFDLPKFDLYFFSIPFIISLGLYFIVLLFLLGRQTSRQRVINSFLTLIFLISAFLISCYFDANIKLIECTACDDGTRVLNFYDINYTKIFIVTLLSSCIPCIWTDIKTHQKANRQTVFKAG